VRVIPLIHGGGDFAFAPGHDWGGSIALLHHEPLVPAQNSGDRGEPRCGNANALLLF
jgi:hypothetical protein